MESLDITTFLARSKDGLLLDVRSPGEYAQAHIPEAISFPLFNDEERARVGTCYKQIGRQEAIKMGLDIFGPKMKELILTLEGLTDSHQNIYLYCWRGGMRSEAIQWLLDLYGFKTYRLIGGYKAFRNWVLEQFAVDYSFLILGGQTGSGKTRILKQLQLLGENVIDLEGLAVHKGSAFGHIGMTKQPSCEMFENLLAGQLSHYYNTDPIRPVWMEDESTRLGHVTIPILLFKRMLKSRLILAELDFEQRHKNILNEYGNKDLQKLIDAVIRIQKRLGPLESKTAIGHLKSGDIAAAFAILLAYYDKWYDRALSKKDLTPSEILRISLSNSPKEDAANLIKLFTNHSKKSEAFGTSTSN